MPDSAKQPGRSGIRTYRDLHVWQHAVELYVGVTSLTRTLPFADRLVFETQIRRAARSVTACIAEGFRRWDIGDYVRSLSVASGSLGEVESDLELIRRTCDVNQAAWRDCLELCDHTGRELTRLGASLRRLRRSGHRRPTT